MKLKLVLISLLILTCAVGSFAQGKTKPKADMDALRAELQAMEDAFAKSYNARDARAVAVYYADDAVSCGPEQAPLVGKEAIIADLKKTFAEGGDDSTIRFEVDAVWASGDLVVEAGKSFIKGADGQEKEVGNYISVFERRDGKLVCVRDSYNSNSDDADDDEDD